MTENRGTMNPDRFNPAINPPRQRPFVAKGHDRQLEQLQKSGQLIEVQTNGSSEPLVGAIVRRDKFTITLAPHNSQVRHLIYKSAIESVTYNEEE